MKKWELKTSLVKLSGDLFEAENSSITYLKIFNYLINYLKSFTNKSELIVTVPYAF